MSINIHTRHESVTVDMKHDYLGHDRLGVERASVHALVRVLHVEDLQIPFFDVRPQNADPRIVYDPILL